MPNGVIYDGVARAGSDASDSAPKLFSGMKFWLSHAIPQRQWFLQNAQTNGAEIVPIEKQADIIFVDHARKNQPPGTYSYRFIERSIRNGRLEDLEDHAVGVATRVARTMGSTVTAPKGLRNPYTPEEDQWLWNMIKPFKDKGGHWKGNEIYKQLEILNPRHTYQSWRDRWIKYVQYQNRSMTEELDRERMVEEIQETETIKEAKRAERQLQRDGRDKLQNEEVEPLRIARPIPRPAVQKPHTQESPNHSAPPASSPRKRKLVMVDHDADETLTPSRLRLLAVPQKRPRSYEQSPRQAPGEQPPTTSDPQSASPSPLMTPDSQRTPDVGVREPVVFTPAQFGDFTPRQAAIVYKAAIAIIQSPWESRDQAWAGFAESEQGQGHTAEEWSRFFDQVILPMYCSRRGKTVEQVLEENREESTTSVEQPQKRQSKAEKAAETREDHSNLAEDDKASSQNDRTVNLEESEAMSIPYEMTCIKCLTSQTPRWRHDRKGRSLCYECGKLSKNIGVLRPSTALVEAEEDVEEEETRNGRETSGELEQIDENIGQVRGQAEQVPENWSPEKGRIPQHPVSVTMIPGKSTVDVGVQTSPIFPPHSVERPRQESPTFEPLSPSTARAPEPNEARKRSAARSQDNSQETAKSASQSIEIKAEIGEEGLQTPPVILRKRKRLSDDPNVLEIPPTPEHIQEEAGSFGIMPAQPSSPNLPRPHPTPRRKAPRPKSTMFMSESESESEDEGHSDIDSSSPIMVSLVSDPINKASSQADDDDLSDIETASVYNFETAPNMSYEWETAPEPPTTIQAQVENQALFDSSDPTDPALDDFELPAPEGGWELVEGEAPAAVADDAEHAGDEAETASEAEFEMWKEGQMKQYQKLGQEHVEVMLHAAIESASLDFEVGDRVLREMVRMYRSGKTIKVVEEGGVVLPKNMPGCWTKEDDHLLFSKNTRDIELTHRKHGTERCNQRFDFLEQYERTELEWLP